MVGDTSAVRLDGFYFLERRSPASFWIAEHPVSSCRSGLLDDTIARMRMSVGFVLCSLAGTLPGAFAQIVPGEPPAEVRIPFAPVPAKVNGQTVLAYELHITNFLPREITLNGIEVLGDGPVREPILRYQENDLIGAIRQYGAPSQPADPRRIPGGFRAVVHMRVTFDKPQAVPSSLRHRLSFSVPTSDGKSEDRHLDIAGLDVSRTAPAVISAPLRDGVWIAFNGPANASIHRRAAILLGGQTHIPERFAIDWMKLADDGKLWHDDPKVNANWYSYGIEVLAVADGVVASIKDGIVENAPLSPARAVSITADTIGGNTVVLALGDGGFAYYAHLQPGSMHVKPGDRVRRGQVLGLLGNSGNSDAPHLHFHISNDNSLASEGLPYVFDSFEVLGTADSDKVFEGGWTPPAGAKPQKLVHEMPAENAAVRFASR
jgi:murein DD-endopeptidase